MDVRELQKMTLDDLWDLHQRVGLILAERLDREKLKIENQLKELGRKFGRAPSDTREHRPKPKVPQKYCNPEYPAQTWSGRGKRPRWVKTLMAGGATLEDLRINSAEFVQDWLKRASR
jgi:DNA-binding protein H-NS